MPNLQSDTGANVRVCTGGFIYSWVYKDPATETAPNHAGIQYGMNLGKQSESVGFPGLAMGCNLR